MIVEEVLLRKVLLLDAPLVATAKPNGKPLETIRRRSIEFVYDVWPETGEPAFYRIGTADRPIGWIGRETALEWNSRLVVRPSASVLPLSDAPESSATRLSPVPKNVPLPIVDWKRASVRIAVWKRERPWSRIDRFGWLRIESVEPGSWGVLLTREELSDVLRRSVDPRTNPPIAPRAERLRSVLGLSIGEPSLGPEGVETARAVLPPIVFQDATAAAGDRPASLAAINARAQPDAAWNSTRLWFVPLNALP